jgi:hypothetical protein
LRYLICLLSIFLFTSFIHPTAREKSRFDVVSVKSTTFYYEMTFYCFYDHKLNSYRAYAVDTILESGLSLWDILIDKDPLEFEKAHEIFPEYCTCDKYIF